MELTRRDFLKLSSVAAAAAVLPVHLLAAPKRPVAYYGPITPNGGDITFTHDDGTTTTWACVTGLPVTLVLWDDETVTMEQERYG